ncbi:HAD-IA family hydrolase [Zavarzinia sp. CC-PAN008]|uniref:HAD-IA family hydrolase n=1 Tax=Zavarzinia sp. CC-PAN008 TaxID=3243332 RepID=UPI003F74903E
MVSAVLWDFGGVILSSPFEAFNTFEAERGLPRDLIRTINATNPDDNAWARFERSDIDLDGFDHHFAEEAKARGHDVRGRDIIALLGGEIRPQMVEALRRCAARFKVACLTNNVLDPKEPDPVRSAAIRDVMNTFHFVVESSKVGVRKPDPRFYQIALDALGIEGKDAVYLDDLGINLKPAKALGMQTIKVGDPDVALAELEAIVGIPLR